MNKLLRFQPKIQSSSVRFKYTFHQMEKHLVYDFVTVIQACQMESCRSVLKFKTFLKFSFMSSEWMNRICLLWGKQAPNKFASGNSALWCQCTSLAELCRASKQYAATHTNRLPRLYITVLACIDLNVFIVRFFDSWGNMSRVRGLISSCQMTFVFFCWIIK